MDTAAFWAQVDRRGPDECWPWTGMRCAGYGRFIVPANNGTPRKQFTAHRLAFELANGRPPEHLICHHCDNPPCCNPRHLFDGTSSDNAQDRIAKGRSNYRGKVLTQRKANRIRAVYSQGRLTQKQIGARFGISTAEVSCVIRGTVWKT